QVAFLPYHDAGITWAHRVALIADVLLLALIGVFLTRPEKSFAMALLGAGLAHPITLLSTIAIFCAVGFFAFFVATVPGERIDRFLAEVAPAAKRSRAGASEASAAGFSASLLGVTRDGRLFGLFERNLNVTDYDLVVDKDVTPGEPTLNLRHRDLRFARLDRTDLHQADFTGANLDGASLTGADLRSVLLRCTDLTALVLSGNRKSAGCATARGANFDKARLGDAVLEGLDLTGARLEEADLAAATLDHAELTGADLYAARLERAELTGGIPMAGANLATAALQGADLTGAKLQGADLTGAAMQGAVLDFADLSGASLRDGDLEGASLFQAKLLLADLSGANLKAASLRDAAIWNAQPPGKGRAELADLAGLNPAPPQATDTAAMQAALETVREPQLAARLRETLAPLIEGAAGKTGTDWSGLVRASRDETSEPRAAVPPAAMPAPAAASFQPSTGLPSDTAPTTGSIPQASVLAPRPPEPQVRAARYLADLACRPRWSNGAVATGLVKRALSPAFNGDIKVFYDGLRQPDCLAARTMPARLFSRLVNTVDQARGR
ncbi:MAG: pentapeptide repeat-containing protein, partial [Proteobacteria bacterium]|nr:pentapeptide repeat-containing protein [Pseudomonadota bacterium]